MTLSAAGKKIELNISGKTKGSFDMIKKNSTFLFPKLSFLILAIFAACLGAITARADEVQLKNGDRISGTIVRMENKVLTIKTPYSGDLSIKWEAVAAISTDSSVHVGLSDDTSAHGALFPAEEGRLSLKAEKVEEPWTFDIDDVEVINPPPDYRWTLRLNAGVDIEKGNTDSEEYHLDTRFFVRTERSRYTVWAELDKEYASNDLTEDSTFSVLKYDHFFTKKWYGWLATLIETDEFKDLNLRSVTGAGPGYQFFESPLRNLGVETGAVYVNEDFDEGEDQEYGALSWRLEYDQYFWDNRVQFFHWQYGLWSVDDSEDVAIYTRTGLRIPLVKGLSATLQYNWDLDNSVPRGEEEIDERFLFTLGWELGNYSKQIRQLSKFEYIMD
jgi:putative salt-induced outer membrane protein YdiY